MVDNNLGDNNLINSDRQTEKFVVKCRELIRREGNLVNKNDFIANIAAEAGFTKKDAEKAIDAYTAVVTKALAAGDKVQLVGFGSFEVKNRAARQGKNPQTGLPLAIPASKAPAFKPGKALKDAVNK